MDEFIKFILSGENLRTILIFASVVFSFGLISMKMDKRFMALEMDMKERFMALESDMKERFAMQEVKFNEIIDKKLDKKFDEFYIRLKSNDFDHINRAIEALTFTLVKNNTITESDKNFVEKHLDL